MEKQAAALLGEPVMIGVLTSSAGSARSMILSAGGTVVGGAVLGAAASIAGDKFAQKRAGDPVQSYRGLIYVAVGATRLGFFSAKRGLLKPSIKELMLAVPRAAVRQFEVSGGLTASPVTIELSDGTVYALEVPLAYKGKAQKVKAALAVA